MNYWAERHRRERAEAENARLRERESQLYSALWVLDGHARLYMTLAGNVDEEVSKALSTKPMVEQGRQYGAVDESEEDWRKAIVSFVAWATHYNAGDPDMLDLVQQHERALRRHIKRGVPDAVRQLPEKMRRHAQTLKDHAAAKADGDEEKRAYIRGQASGVRYWRHEVEAALTSAPASEAVSQREAAADEIVGVAYRLASRSGDEDAMARIVNLGRVVAPSSQHEQRESASEAVPDAVRQLPDQMSSFVDNQDENDSWDEGFHNGVMHVVDALRIALAAAPASEAAPEFSPGPVAPLPDCMMPDGAEPCEGFKALQCQRGGAVPDGWKLVPVEPTEEMIAAGTACYGSNNNPRQIYRAMIAAAPSRQHEQGE